VRVSDAGVYECQSENRVGTDLHQATIDVGCEFIVIGIILLFPAQ